jgi:alpha(1,3/1,4) fucosyltransferase
MIKVFPLNNLQYSPFFTEYGRCLLEKSGIVISNEADADCIISSGHRRLIVYALKYGNQKKYLVFSDEPYLSRLLNNSIQLPFLPKLDILNVYTGIYYNNFRWVPNGSKLPLLDENFELTSRKAVVVMGYGHKEKKKIVKRAGRDFSINQLRMQIALEGHHRNVLDIYGRGWPQGLSHGESRGDANWRRSKQEILENYHFNLAFENTAWPYYCTEKIWDAIQANCLPIYYSRGTSIYENFPRDSFLDFCDFASTDDLFDYIQSMTIEDFRLRMNRCLETFNLALDKAPLIELPINSQMIDELAQKGIQPRFMSDLTKVAADKIRAVAI